MTFYEFQSKAFLLLAISPDFYNSSYFDVYLLLIWNRKPKFLTKKYLPLHFEP